MAYASNFEFGKRLLEIALQGNEKIPETLYHYTGLRGLRGILENKKLWASHVAYLNDAKEFRHGIKIVADILEQERWRVPGCTGSDAAFLLGCIEQMFDARVFVASFTDDGGDRLSQWRGYCNSGAGFSVGFDRDIINSLRSITGGMMFIPRQCVYGDGHLRNKLWLLFETLSKCLKEAGSDDQGRAVVCANFAFSVAVEAATLKDYGFSEEKEWRVICVEVQPDSLHMENVGFHEGKSCHVPHLELPLESQNTQLSLDSITIGPNPLPSNDVIQSVSLMCKKFGVACEQLSHSETPFRYW